MLTRWPVCPFTVPEFAVGMSAPLLLNVPVLGHLARGEEGRDRDCTVCVIFFTYRYVYIMAGIFDMYHVNTYSRIYNIIIYITGQDHQVIHFLQVLLHISRIWPGKM